MTNYQYVIIGGGMTAASAVDGIREVDATSGIGLFSAEPDPPYDRPPLTKALWKGMPLETIWRQTDGKGVTMHRGRVVKEIAPEHKRIVDDQGAACTYQILLLATGGKPRRLAFGEDQIIYFRTLTETGRRFAVIGGGFIGSELAAALAMNGKEVVMIFPGHAVGDRVFPRPLAQDVSNYYRQQGVEILAGQQVVGMETRGQRRVLKTSTNRDIEVDGIVAGVGIEPNVELAKTIGLRIENGIVVDERLRTSHPDILAAGGTWPHSTTRRWARA